MKARKSRSETPAPVSESDATVFVVDDDEAMRSSLAFLIKSVGLRVETFESAERFLEHYDPAMRGCLLLDVRMPGMSGLELQQHLAENRIRIPVIILTAHGDVPMAVRAMRAGAFDFIEKPTNDQMLLERVHEAIRRDLAAHEEEEAAEEIERRIESLSPRERQVMGMVVEGMLNKQIAHALDISIKTVEVHRSRVMEKMQAGSLAELVRMVARTGR